MPVAAIRSDTIARSQLESDKDQQRVIFKALGDLDQYELLDEDVLLALYVPSNVAASGKCADGTEYKIFTTQNNTAETRYQGKIGVFIKAGPSAFKFYPNGQEYQGIVPKRGDWMVFRIADGHEIFLKDESASEFVNCNRIHWSQIKMRVTNPKAVR